MASRSATGFTLQHRLDERDKCLRALARSKEATDHERAEVAEHCRAIAAHQVDEVACELEWRLLEIDATRTGRQPG